MPIIRSKTDADFFVMHNATAQDNALSWEARGMLVYILSKPDGWRFNLAELVEQSPAGKDRCSRIVNELIAAGYVSRPEPKITDNPRPPSSVWERLRDAVFRRDDFTCQYCGKRGGRLECDHVHPLSRGGSNDLSNLVTACFPCNRSKRDMTVDEWGGATT